MTAELAFLITTAASIAFLHTLLGPDHFLPFVALGKSRNWSLKKMMVVTMGCGLAHSIGSILLGLVGIWAGSALTNLSLVENFRGDLAAWALLSLGILYTVWGLKKANNGKEHSHFHSHANGIRHNHPHTHISEHTHLHETSETKSKLIFAPWSIFIIFVLGPCEPLIPLMMYPAAKASIGGMALVVGTFVFVTVVTMMTISGLVYSGLKFLPAATLGRYSHAIAGTTLTFCGFAIIGLGL